MNYLKNILKYIYLKWHRLLYVIKYGFPLFNKPVDPERLVYFHNWVGNINSAAIIGKGASVFESNPLELVQKSDFKILLNSVDVEYLEKFIGNKFDAQISTQVGPVNSPIPVLSKENIKKKGIKLLICNNTLFHNNGKTIRNFWNYFNNRVDKISYLPSPEQQMFKIDVEKYGERVTMASTVLCLLYNIQTVNKIIFVGVDAFHFGYSYRPGVEGTSKHFYSINEGGYDDPRTTHGIPFLRFLFDSLEEVNSTREVIALFPKVLKQFISFPEVTYIQFYD